VVKQTVVLTVNGTSYELLVDHHATLLEVLRENLGLTGTKEGCGLGACGACTVLVDGKAMLACIMPVLSLENRSIETVEGLADHGSLSKLQERFLDHGAIQCGFLHPRHAHVSRRPVERKEKSQSGRNYRGYCRQFVQVHRIPAHCGGHTGCRLAR